MKQVTLGILAMSLVGLFAFTKTTNTTRTNTLNTYQDTIPYHHYDASRIYFDPNTGDSVEIWMDPTSHHLMNKRNNSVITLYVDPITSDTLYGEGYIINDMVTRMPNGKYSVDTTKVKIEGNKIKYKDGSGKGKIKATDDKIKTKDGHDKTKVKDAGDSVKVKKG